MAQTVVSNGDPQAIHSVDLLASCERSESMQGHLGAAASTSRILDKNLISSRYALPSHRNAKATQHVSAACQFQMPLSDSGR